MYRFLEAIAAQNMTSAVMTVTRQTTMRELPVPPGRRCSSAAAREGRRRWQQRFRNICPDRDRSANLQSTACAAPLLVLTSAITLNCSILTVEAKIGSCRTLFQSSAAHAVTETDCRPNALCSRCSFDNGHSPLRLGRLKSASHHHFAGLMF
jgi:hypothetical protein